MAFAFVIAAPAIINRKPFLFYDSAQYFDVGRAIVAFALPEQGDAPTLGAEPAPAPSEADASNANDDAGGGLAAIAGGRSPIYSVLIYLVGSVFTLYGVVAIQSLLAAWLVFRLLDVGLGAGHVRYKLALVAALSLLTPLGFHAGFVMPDVFAGFYVIAALLLATNSTAGRFERLLLGGLVLASALTHATVPALGVALLVLLLLAGRFFSAFSRYKSAAWWLAASIVLSFAFSAFYAAAVERAAGETIGNPPYLMARVIADGPGERFLNERCDDPRFAACMFRGVDYRDHNDFLWGSSGATPNYATADRATQLALQAEERSFVIAAVLNAPFEQAGASLINAATQFVLLGVPEIAFGAERMAREPAFADQAILQATPNLRSCLERGDACLADTEIRRLWSRLVSAATLAALIALLLMLARERAALLSPTTTDAGRREMLLMAAILVLVLAANAALCGALSGPHDRYQARLAWIGALFLGVLAHKVLTRARHATA